MLKQLEFKLKKFTILEKHHNVVKINFISNFASVLKEEKNYEK